MLDPLEVLLVAMLGVPATGLLLWLLWSRLIVRGELSFAQSMLVGLVATVIVGGGIYLADPSVPLLALLVGLLIGFLVGGLSVDYADDWGEPLHPYALGCAPLVAVAALLLAIFLFAEQPPHLIHVLLMGGIGGPAFGLLLGLAWLRWGSRGGPMGCLPIVAIAGLAALAVGGLDWYFADWTYDAIDDFYYYDEGPPPLELFFTVLVGGILALLTAGSLMRFRSPDQPLAIGCLPGFGVAAVVALAVLLAGQNLLVIDGGGPLVTPAPTTVATPALTATPGPPVTATVTPAQTPATVVTPAPFVTPTPAAITPVPVITPVPPSERTEFVDFLVNAGVLQPAYNGVSMTDIVGLATIPDELGDLFKADGGQPDVADPPDIQSGFVARAPAIPSTIRDLLYVSCGEERGAFNVVCGQQRDPAGPLNIIWIGMRQPLGQFTGGPFLVADEDTDVANNPQPNANFPLAPNRAGNLQFSPVTGQGGRVVLMMYDFNRPGQFRRTDALLFYGAQSVGWLVFGDLGTLTPGIEKLEGNPLDGDFSADVLGPRPVVDQPYPALMPYDVTAPCGALCQP